MSTKKPKILIVFAKQGTDTSTRFGGFVKRIQHHGGFDYADVEYMALESLLFHIEDKTTARVTDSGTGRDLADYTFVYFKSWQSMPELAAAAAIYLEAKGVPYADTQVRHELKVKTTNYMAMWKAGVTVPETLWGSPAVLTAYIDGTGVERYPLIIKAVDGEKGKDNFLAYNRDEAARLLGEATVPMLLQQFIPNDGDYRIGVYGNQARWAIYRRSGGTSHLNNTSAGGSAELLSVAELDSAIITIAERAARAVELQISGVDVVKDKETGKLYIFEANQGSQIVTGVYADTNMRAFSDGLKQLVGHTTIRHRHKSLSIIGRRTAVEVIHGDAPFRLIAKVDTGAYQSAMHVTNVMCAADADGREYVEYVMPTVDRAVRTYEFWRAVIKSSNGEEQERYVVPMRFVIQGTTYDTRVSLADRSTQKYPLLLGRKLLRGNFLVNVEYTELEEEV